MTCADRAESVPVGRTFPSSPPCPADSHRARGALQERSTTRRRAPLRGVVPLASGPNEPFVGVRDLERQEVPGVVVRLEEVTDELRRPDPPNAPPPAPVSSVQCRARDALAGRGRRLGWAGVGRGAGAGGGAGTGDGVGLVLHEELRPRRAPQHLRLSGLTDRVAAGAGAGGGRARRRTGVEERPAVVAAPRAWPAQVAQGVNVVTAWGMAGAGTAAALAAAASVAVVGRRGGRGGAPGGANRGGTAGAETEAGKGAGGWEP